MGNATSLCFSRANMGNATSLCFSRANMGNAMSLCFSRANMGNATSPCVSAELTWVTPRHSVSAELTWVTPRHCVSAELTWVTPRRLRLSRRRIVFAVRSIPPTTHRLTPEQVRIREQGADSRHQTAAACQTSVFRTVVSSVAAVDCISFNGRLPGTRL